MREELVWARSITRLKSAAFDQYFSLHSPDGSA